ncbi:macrosialin [Silurus asotus]|uniref:Macrosialin n=1 Tax=Silurus asotus TaxID=30991 RepID=A0AAD5ALN1_SILAS|nr:macrosialin [Silurus asotus]
MVQSAIQVQVNNRQMVGTYIVPGIAEGTGNCKRNTVSFMITLKEGYFSMNFTKNDTAKKVFVNTVAVNLTYAFKSGVLSYLEKKNESVQLFSRTARHSYSCKSESVVLGNGIYQMFSQDRMQAFNFTNNQFGPLDLCKADQPDY